MEPPTLTLTAPQGSVPTFQLCGCQECAHWCASDPRDKGLVRGLRFLEGGRVDRADLRTPAFRCWRALWLTTVAPEAAS